MPRRRISDTATATLDHWLDQFMRGVLHYGELPSAVEAYLHVGYAHGRQSRQPEIDALEREVNRLHFLAFHTPGERRERLLARIDEGLATADEATWDRLEHDLQQMAGQQLHTNSIRTGPAPDENGVTSDHRTQREAA